MMPFWLGVIILSASALGVVIAVVGMFRLMLERIFLFTLLLRPGQAQNIFYNGR